MDFIDGSAYKRSHYMLTASHYMLSNYLHKTTKALPSAGLGLGALRAPNCCFMHGHCQYEVLECASETVFSVLALFDSTVTKYDHLDFVHSLAYSVHNPHLV